MVENISKQGADNASPQESPTLQGVLQMAMDARFTTVVSKRKNTYSLGGDRVTADKDLQVVGKGMHALPFVLSALGEEPIPLNSVSSREFIAVQTKISDARRELAEKDRVLEETKATVVVTRRDLRATKRALRRVETINLGLQDSLGKKVDTEVSSLERWIDGLSPSQALDMLRHRHRMEGNRVSAEERGTLDATIQQVIEGKIVNPRISTSKEILALFVSDDPLTAALKARLESFWRGNLPQSENPYGILLMEMQWVLGINGRSELGKVLGIASSTISQFVAEADKIPSAQVVAQIEQSLQTDDPELRALREELDAIKRGERTGGEGVVFTRDDEATKRDTSEDLQQWQTGFAEIDQLTLEIQQAEGEGANSKEIELLKRKRLGIALKLVRTNRGIGPKQAGQYVDRPRHYVGYVERAKIIISGENLGKLIELFEKDTYEEDREQMDKVLDGLDDMERLRKVGPLLGKIQQATRTTQAELGASLDQDPVVFSAIQEGKRLIFVVDLKHALTVLDESRVDDSRVLSFLKAEHAELIEKASS